MKKIDAEIKVLISYNKKLNSEVDYRIENLQSFIFEKYLDFKKHLKDIPIEKNFKLQSYHLKYFQRFF